MSLNNMSTGFKMKQDPDSSSFHCTSEAILEIDVIKTEVDNDYDCEENAESTQINSEFEHVQSDSSTNHKCMKVRKKRGENWTSEEKEILRQLVARSAHILNDKSTKTNTVMLKSKEWKNVANKLNKITAKKRSEGEIKLAWKRLKLAAKANLMLNRSEQSQTGGGQKSSSPSPEDLAVMCIAPHNIVIDVNNYDSDTKQIPIPPHSGPSSADDSTPLTGDDTESNNKNKHVIEDGINVIQENKSKGVHQNRIERGRQDVIDSNINFKKRQLEILEIEHNYNVQISQLKIKKLQLEIALLENQNVPFTENEERN